MSVRLVYRLVLVAALFSAAFAAAADPQFVTGQAAVLVVGQKSFSANRPGTAADEFGTVTGVALAGQRLIVADGGLNFSLPVNNRILIFNDVSNVGATTPADIVVGQDAFGKDSPGLSERSFNRPVGVSSDGQRLVVADTGNNRVLIFNTIPASNGAAADVVVGQPDFRTSSADTTDSKLRGPTGVFTDGRRLFIADTLNHRVLIYNTIPTANGAKADVVLGQANFTAHVDAAATASTLRDPTGVFSDGTRLIITDLGHNRVLIYNRIPTANGAAADIVIGQPDFTKEAAGTSAASLNFPRNSYTDGTRLFIADTGNNRVVVFNTFPTASGTAADAALGQKDFFSANDPEVFDPQRLTSGAMGFPVALSPGPGNSVLVADSANRRVLQFAEGVPLFQRGAVVSAANFGGNGLPRPENVNVEVQEGGQLPVGTYYIKVTAEGGILFESVPSSEVAVSVLANSKLVVTFDEVPRATAYRVYIGGSPGGQSRYFSTTAPAAGQAIDRKVEITTLATINTVSPRLEITPGGIASLFGTDLAPSVVAASSIPLPRELGGVSVLVNGVDAPLFFVAPNQINFQVPVELVGSSASVQVRKRSGAGVVLSSAIPVGLNELTPGLFTVSGDGTGRLLAFHADFTPVDDAHPLVAGEHIIFFGTGVQQVSLPGPALATATFDLRSKGELKVTRQGQVTWSTSFAEIGRVYVSTDGGPETLFTAGPSGDQNAGFISDGHVYRFVLKPVTADVEGNPVATVLLDTRVPSTGDPTGQIQLAASIVTWSTGNAANAGVYLSIDGGPEALFASGTSGERAAPIEEGHHYRFNLRYVVDGIPGNLLASAAVDTFSRGVEGLTGQLNIDDQGKVTWSSSNVSAARVTISSDGGAESVYGEGTSGDKAAETGLFQAGRFYRLILRQKFETPPVASGEAAPAGTFIDTTSSVAIQGRDAPIRFGGFAPGLVGVLQFNVKIADDLEMNGEDAEVRVFVGSIPANQVFLPVFDASEGTISVDAAGVVSWSTSNVSAARVFVSVNGGEEVLFTEGTSGTQTTDFIVAGNVYRFILRKVVNGETGRVLAVATVDRR